MNDLRAMFPGMFADPDPVEPPSLWGTLDWLNQWHHHNEFIEDVQPAPNDHLYPHL